MAEPASECKTQPEAVYPFSHRGHFFLGGGGGAPEKKELRSVTEMAPTYPELPQSGEDDAQAADSAQVLASYLLAPPLAPPSSPFSARLSPCVNSIKGLLTAILGCALARGL